MLINQIELPVTFAFNGNFYDIDKSVYLYDSSERYAAGVYVIHGDSLFKVLKGCTGVEPESGDNYSEVEPANAITKNLTTKDEVSCENKPSAVDAYTKAEADGKFQPKAEMSQFAKAADLSKYTLKTELSTYARKSDLDGLVKTTELTNYAAKSEVETLKSQVAALVKRVEALESKGG